MDFQQRLEQGVIAALQEHRCPEPDQLADYSLGLLDGTEQLIVAQHVRACPLCRYVIELARPPETALPWMLGEPATPKPGALEWLAHIPQLLIARPLHVAPADVLRGDPRGIRQYVGADLLIDLTIPAPVGETWELTGWVRRDADGVAGCAVILRAGRRRRQTTTDAQGFFSFETVPAGSYTLTVTDGQVQVRIQGLRLSLDAPDPI